MKHLFLHSVMNLMVNLTLLMVGTFEAYTHLDTYEQGIIVGLITIALLTIIGYFRRKRLKANRVKLHSEFYYEGMNAAKKGRLLTECPYTMSTYAFEDWVAGYYNVN